MITERDLIEAIAECQGERNPNAQTCIKLAAFLTIRAHMFGDPDMTVATNTTAPDAGMSFAVNNGQPEGEIVRYDSGTEFSEAIDGKRADHVYPVLDEAMSILQTLHPRLYAATIKHLKK